jgi:leucyl aminopeptidase
MRIRTSSEAVTHCIGDVLVAPVFTGGAALPSVTAELAAASGLDLRSIADRHDLDQPGDSCWVAAGSALGCPDLLLVCVGRVGPDGVPADDLRAAATSLARSIGRPVAVCVLDRVDVADQDPTEIVARAMTIGSYRFTRYRSCDEPNVLREIVLPGSDESAARAGSVAGEATNLARDLTNTAPGDLTPEAFAGVCAEQAAAQGISLQVLDVAQLRDGGFGGIVGVGAASANPPVLVCLESGDPSAPATALIGKGITFDSGGLDVKNAESMVQMKDDMGGAAAVLAAMTAAVSLGVDTHLRAYLPCAENAIGPRSLRPGDVLRHRDGRTSEIVSPDAEGRLVLADAITYAKESAPARIVDIATLTGSTGLGPDIWGILGTSQPLVEALLRAGGRVGEPGWQLPLFDGYRKKIRSSIADIRNHELGMFWRHQAIWAALYLSEFVGETPWAHLDIAATVFRTEPDEVWPAGATGSGTGTLLQFLRADGNADAKIDNAGSEGA